MKKLTIREASETFGVSRQAIQQAIDRGSLPAEKIISIGSKFGFVYLIRRADLDRYFERRVKSYGPKRIQQRV